MPAESQNDELVMNLVEQALTQPLPQREAFLRSVCGGDPTLFEQAWKYVQWEERMNGFLLNPLYAPPANEHRFEPGQMLEQRFRIVREVAQGGMGVVYEALDEKLDRRIAIKCAKSGFHKRLPPEVRSASTVGHPNVCRTYEIHTASTDEGEIDFLTMEFLEGQTLSERLREGPLPPKEARTIAQQLCSGLAEAHRNHVIHGDLKSNNVILTGTGEGVRAVITDFGLARLSASQQTTVQSGELGGAPDYMAPELLKGGRPSMASDIYALGVMLHEIAVGRRPFGKDTPWEERVGGRPAALKHGWGKIVGRCLEPDPARRWRSVGEIAKALAPSYRLHWSLAAATAVFLAILGALIHSQMPTPRATVRLAFLPFETDATNKALSEGLLDDTSKQLRRVSASQTTRLTVIPFSDTVKNGVGKLDQAAGLLGATHILTGKLRREGPGISIKTYLIDVHSRLPIQEWQAEYQPNEIREMPMALAGMITGALRLPPLAASVTVNAAAYADFTRGTGLLRRNSVDEALPFLEKAVKADWDSPLTHATLAEAQILKYQLVKQVEWQQQAKASLARAELRNPDLALVRAVSGLVNQSGGIYESAESDYRRALEIEPQNGDIWRSLGDLYVAGSQFPRAVAAYQKSIELQPGYFKNYQQLCSLYADQANFDEAIRQCQKLIDLVPQLPDAHYSLAKPYLAAGRYTDGERELRTALALDPMSSNTLHALAIALVYQKRYWEALPYFKRAVELGPLTTVLFLNLGTTYRLANLPQDAKEAYVRGLAAAEAELAKNPRDPTVRSRLAYLCARLGQQTRAAFEAAQAQQLSNGSVEVGRMIAQTYEAIGERGRALAVAETLPDEILRRLRRSPESPELSNDPQFQELLRSRHIQ